MGLQTYADLGRNAVVRRILGLGLLIRIPMWAAGVVVTLHVVTHLGRSYAEAGLVDAVLALAIAISGPWRGRLLDRIGLRATVAPSLAATAVCWCLAPWVGYWPLIVLVGVAGLFTVPTFSIVRQVLIGAVPDRQRTAVLSVDSVFVEFSFMIGPVLGVLAATYLGTPVALLVCQLAAVVGGLALWIDNPSLGGDTAGRVADTGAGTGDRHRLRDLISPAVLVILLTCATATVVLTGADLGTVAALRHMGHTTSIGWVLALWGAGSAVGGIVYGALRRHPPSAVLLVGLGASTALVALADDRLTFTVLLFVSGLFCAPTITATVDDLSRAVPARVRGEAMGWHGSALTLGGAAGAPLVGSAIDSGGWQSAFEVAGLLGLAIAAAGLVWRLARGRRALLRAGPEGGEDLASGLGPVQGVEVQAGSVAGE
ncbi:MFS transporter [Nocardioides terrisoli]|uniref:MFS transporter n=1 Tax=Nocardioides terrisoli TaxID=3388267 RepID=UPI00287B92B6|nr:MFS transporter [Nocardioides marmorisolisilvae]